MLTLVAALLLTVPALPRECEPPAARDVVPLSKLGRLEGTLSAGLDSVATWCFDSSGAWVAGRKPKKAEAVPPDAEPEGECRRAVQSCEAAAKALEAAAPLRELAVAALAELDAPWREQRYVPKRAGLREALPDRIDCGARVRGELFAMAQARMDHARWASLVQSEYQNFRAWLVARSLECRNAVLAAKKDPTKIGVGAYRPEAPAGLPPQRGDAAEGPGGGVPGADGGAVATAPAGVAAAPAGVTAAAAGVTAAAGSAAPLLRADAGPGALAAWVRDGGPARADGAVAARPDAGALAAAPDAGALPVASLKAGDGGSGLAPAARAVALTVPVDVGLAAGMPAGPAAPAGGSADEDAALLARWKDYAARQAEQEQDRDYIQGYLASRELRACRCQRVSASQVVRSLEAARSNVAALAQLRADDAVQSRCMECGLNAFSPWRTRATRQCALLDQLTEYELGRLEASDDANGLPPRCLDDARRKRGITARPGAPDAGAQPAGAPASPTVAAAGPKAPPGGPATGPATSPGAAGPSRGGAPAAPAPQAAQAGPFGPPMTGPGVAPGGVDPYTPPSAFAPVMPREDGRMYVRLSMSSTCVAEISPGPIQARTGDLLLVPFGARQLTVKSPCGGLAEIYWGKEPRPRFSEVFGRQQPLVFDFKSP